MEDNRNERLEEMIHEAVDVGLEFQSRESVVETYSPEQLIEIAQEELPREGSNAFELLETFQDEMMDYCVNQSNPRYLAFPDAGNRPETLAADALIGLLNQNLIADVKSAPMGTYLEIQLLEWLRNLVGYDTSGSFPASIADVGGAVTFGGVLSNISALLVARNKRFPNTHERGVPNSDGVYVLVPEVVSHYSIDLAMSYLGFGTNSVIEIELDEEYRMDKVDLQNKMERITKEGGEVLAVCAYAGDSRTMQIDDFPTIRSLCDEFGSWFHVDACHGGALLFSERKEEKLAGIEYADSVTLDPHKTLKVTYPCSIVLFKEESDLLRVSENFDMTIKEGTYDLGQITPFVGSKSFESLKLWFLIKSLGVEGVGEIVDRRTELAEHLKSLIDDSEHYVSLHDVNINSQTFLFFPKHLRKQHKRANDRRKREIEKRLDRLNKEIHDRIYYEGESCVHTFKLTDEDDRALLKGTGKRQVLGMILGNERTDEVHLDVTVSLLERTAKNVYDK